MAFSIQRHFKVLQNGQETTKSSSDDSCDVLKNGDTKMACIRMWASINLHYFSHYIYVYIRAD